MKSIRFHDSKLKLVKALLFRSIHETEAPTAGFCPVFICGRTYIEVWSTECVCVCVCVGGGGGSMLLGSWRQ